MKNALVRSISGLVYIVVIVAAIFCGWKAFYGLTALFGILAMIEYTQMIAPAESNVSAMRYLALGFDTLGVLALVGAPAMIVWYGPAATFAVIAAYVLARLVAALYDHREGAAAYAAKSIGGVIYIGMPLGLLNAIYTMRADDAGALFVLLVFACIWLNDTGAYCVGSTIGKNRLFERLSPKKSWEGFWGGFAFCVAFGVLCYYQFNGMGLTLGRWIAVGAIASVFATWGDLFESLIKRTAGVKDAGHIIPGHGGILDRIDSLLFVAPAVYIFLSFAL